MSPLDSASSSSNEGAASSNAANPDSRVAVSAVCVAKDAGGTIDAALASVRFCDEIVVIVDNCSTDDTEDIARQRADRVDIQPWAGYGPTKRMAIEQAHGQWILIIDSDELITPELASAIRNAVKSGDTVHAAYSLRRRTRYLGRWMRHGDWGRDRVIRLFDRHRAELSSDLVHESVKVEGTVPVLSGILLHEGDQTIEPYLRRLDRYTTLAAEELFAQGRRANWLSITVRPAFKFIQAYVLRLGFLDGWQGLVLAYYSSVYVFTKYAKLTRLARTGSNESA